jgi:hypothetical protein
MGGEAGDMPQTSFVKSKSKGGNATVKERVFYIVNTLLEGRVSALIQNFLRVAEKKLGYSESNRKLCKS